MTQTETRPVLPALPRRMWVVWMLFFFQFAAIGIYYTFLNVFYKQDAGLTGTEIGLMNMVTALVGMGSAVLWGYVSDRTGSPRLWIALGAAVALLSAQAIPYAHGFAQYLILGCIGSLGNTAPGTLVDSTALSLLGARREEYGRYRLGGSIGYIITALTAGFLFEKTGLGLIFPAYGLVMTCLAITALLLPRSTRKLEAREQGQFGRMMAQPAWLLFIGCMFLVWIATNASIMFLPVSLSTMGAPQSLIGIVMTISAVVELPFMFFSSNMLRRFGPIRLLLVAMTLMVVRNTLLWLMPSPSWAIAVNTINGPAFVFFWNSAVTYANKMAPPSMAGTAQGMLASTTGLAGVLSSVLTGYLFDLIGPKGIFLVMAVCCLAALVLFATGSLLRRPKPAVETGPQP